VINEAGVHLKWGVAPASIPDYLALVGDSADGIPGIPRWGAKSTAAVLSHYLKLENIPASSTDWELKVRGARTLAENLHMRREDAFLYRDLATLRTDLNLGASLDDLRWRGPDVPRLQALCAQLNFDRFVERAINLAAEKASL